MAGSGAVLDSLEGVGCEDGVFWVKKLEMVGCLRFRDGDCAEEGGEEWGAMMCSNPDNGRTT